MAGEAAERDIAFAGAARQAEMVRTGEVSPTELVRLSLGRIERLDPQLNCFRKVFAEKALLEAEREGLQLQRECLPVCARENAGVMECGAEGLAVEFHECR